MKKRLVFCEFAKVILSNWKHLKQKQIRLAKRLWHWNCLKRWTWCDELWTPAQQEIVRLDVAMHNLHHIVEISVRSNRSNWRGMTLDHGMNDDQWLHFINQYVGWFLDPEFPNILTTWTWGSPWYLMLSSSPFVPYGYVKQHLHSGLVGCCTSDSWFFLSQKLWGKTFAELRLYNFKILKKHSFIKIIPISSKYSLPSPFQQGE